MVETGDCCINLFPGTYRLEANLLDKYYRRRIGLTFVKERI